MRETFCSLYTTDSVTNGHTLQVAMSPSPGGRIRFGRSIGAIVRTESTISFLDVDGEQCVLGIVDNKFRRTEAGMKHVLFGRVFSQRNGVSYNSGLGINDTADMKVVGSPYLEASYPSSSS